MENKDYLKITGVVVGITAMITYGTVYLVKTMDKKRNRKEIDQLKKSLEVLGSKRGDRNWWLTKECKDHLRCVIEWANKNNDGNLDAELEMTKDELKWMRNDYKQAFWTIYDYVKIKERI